jgi:F-type H+-transporting ATPase subunit gamma
MPGVRDIKRRIRSIKNTQQITKAMKMVAAAKLRKAQSAIASTRPYAEKLEEVMARLLTGLGFQHKLLEERPAIRVGLVVITGDRGLCGGYNANVIRLAEKQLKEVAATVVTIPVKKSSRGFFRWLTRSQQEADVQEVAATAAIMAVGKRGNDYFRHRQLPIERCVENLGDNPTLAQAKQLARELMRLFLTGELDQVHLIYNQYLTAIRHQPVAVQLLPMRLVSEPGPARGKNLTYLYEPSQSKVLEDLLPKQVEMLVFQALLEAKASEHGARMTAMTSATENAGEMIDKLTLSFNRARQAAITKEINEVVSGAQALK